MRYLKQIGFTDGEISVYKAILKLGKTTIGPISKSAKVTPAKTYPILDKLIEKGLISKIKHDRTLYFSANDPDRLLTYMDEKKNELENQRKRIEQELPRLRNIPKERITEARVLTGMGGLKTFYGEHNRMLLASDKIFRVFSFEDDWNREDVKRFIQKQDLIRKQLGIKVEVIANKKIKKYIDPKNYKLVNIKFTEQDIPVGTIVSPTQIALMTWKEEPIIIVIDSKEIGESYTKFFEGLWKQAKK
jgi:HTH-type transcriptional regulator, sugar sensing transcriptional regulator